MSNWQSSTAQVVTKGPRENKKSRLYARRKLRLIVLITKDPHIKDMCRGIVVGHNECFCQRLGEWKKTDYRIRPLRGLGMPISKTLLRQIVRDDSRVCRKCRECTRPDEGLLMLEVG